MDVRRTAVGASSSEWADGPDELRGQAAERVAVLLVASGIGGVFVATFVEPPSYALGLLGGATIAIAALARSAGQRSLWAGALVLLLGAGLLLAAAPSPLVLPWFSLLPPLAAGLLGARWGIVTAAVATVALLAGGGEGAWSSAALGWAGLLLYWQVSSPLRTTLSWSWSSYAEARRLAEEARTRQAELALLSRSLNDSYDRLEQLNLELERARREAQEARRSKEQFVTSVSHELRTPLNLVIGFCEMMVLAPDDTYGEPLPTAYRADLEAMYRNASHLSSLVDDILDLSQVDADRMALHRQPTSLRRIAEEAAATVESLFTHRELGLAVDVQHDLPDLPVDPTRIRQILINLLSNAARVMRRGAVRVSAALESDSVVLSVADDGPGIPPADLPHVFEEFRRGRDQARGTGSGLGLAVSKRFAELHGGTMWVESELGVGSTFKLRLPLADDAPPLHPGAPGGWLRTRPRGEALRRLLVLDDGQTRPILARYMERYVAIDAETLRAEARERVPGPVHAVVLAAPGAAEQLDSLRSELPRLEGLPVLSCAFQTASRTAEDLNATDYLVKPVGIEDLRGSLQRIGVQPRRALVVDDEPDMLRLLSRMVRAVAPGCRVQVAPDGAAALAAVRARCPDLVLLDLLMPDVDGYEVLATLRDDPATADLPIVLVTAKGTHKEAVVTEALNLRRTPGLTVREATGWMGAGLDALLGVSTPATS